MTLNFKDLETRGYLVIKDFLNETEIAQCLAGYQRAKENNLTNGFENKNYCVFQRLENHGLTVKLSSLLSEIRSHTDIKADYVRQTSEYFDNAVATFGWHQDHEPYYQYQDNYNVISMWIPLIKARPQVSGIKMIPFDRLMEHCPDITVTRFLRKGAKRILTDKKQNTTTVIDDSVGDRFQLSFDIETIEDIPEISVGDLLINRCDVLHCTQDTIDHRVSFSIRCIQLAGELRRDKFYDVCDVQKRFMKNNPNTYNPALAFFKDPARQTMTIAQMMNMKSTDLRLKTK
jgi:hypothetical protein